MAIFQWIAKYLPASGRRRRPFDTIFAADERPPNNLLAMLALQHVAIALPSLVFLTVFASVDGISTSTVQSMMSASLIGMAIGTAFQAWGGRLGSGVFLVHSIDPIMIALATAAVASGGPGALASVSIVAAITALCLGPLIPKLRPMFPTTVVGTVICMVGISLIHEAFTDAWMINEQMQVDWNSVIISSAALVSMVGLSVWGGRKIQLVAVVVGLIVGLVVAIALGEIHGLNRVTEASWLAAPTVVVPSFHVPIGIVVAVMLTALMNQLENMGGAVVMDKMTNADWRRPDMMVMTGSVRATAFADLTSGLLGGAPTGYNPDNVALASASKATSRYIGLATAALLLLLAFLPKATAMVTLIPTALRGGLAIYTALFLIVAGIEMATSRSLDSRGTFTIGIALCSGLAVMLLPGLSKDLPESLKFITESGFVVTGIMVIVLNALFRLGTKQRAAATLDAPDRSLNQQITEFIEAHGATWGARREVLHRAIAAAIEAAEAIMSSGGRHIVSIRGFFDEFNLNLELVHTGHAIALDRGPGLSQDEADRLLHADVEELDIDLALQQIGSAMLHHLADRVTSEGAGTIEEPACLKLHFEH